MGVRRIVTGHDENGKAIPGVLNRVRAVSGPVLIAGLDPELPDADERVFLCGKERWQEKCDQERANAPREDQHR